MRFMMIVKASRMSEAGTLPSEEMLAKMGKYNEELVRAGVMLDGAGLQSSAKGTRIKFASNGKKSVVDGPFSETKELIAGYWIIEVKSREEALEWALRVPNPSGDGNEGEIELRQFFELEDFGESEAIDHHRGLEKELAARRQSAATPNTGRAAGA